MTTTQLTTGAVADGWLVSILLPAAYVPPIFAVLVLIFAAIRSEVLGAVGSIGQEVNKIVADFGTKITWDVAGYDFESHGGAAADGLYIGDTPADQLLAKFADHLCARVESHDQ